MHEFEQVVIYEPDHNDRYRHKACLKYRAPRLTALEPPSATFASSDNARGRNARDKVDEDE